MKSYFSIAKIILQGRAGGKILIATILSFTFSITVILCTFGLMDGFDQLLKSGLRHSSGDLLLTHRKGFFTFDEKLKKNLDSIKPLASAPLIQAEAFASFDESSRGILIRGVDTAEFAAATGLHLSIPVGTIAIGEELSHQLKVKPGQSIALTLAKGASLGNSIPVIETLEVSSIVKHGIYQKDLRLTYMNRDELSSLLNLGHHINLLILGLEDPLKKIDDLDMISKKKTDLQQKLSSNYLVRPFWSEYDFLIEAVKVEKFSISLILQLIVIVALFNIMAFIIYMMEKKSQDFFLLRAIGLSLNQLSQFWFISLIGIWMVSCLGAIFLAEVFNLSLKVIPFFQIPGEIYVLSSLSLDLKLKSYIIVFSLSLAWVSLAAALGHQRLRKRAILTGLREEFN
jgi:ABC-type lipoprotein release transport system permease subunit